MATDTSSVTPLSLQNQENDLLKQILQKYIDQPVKVVVYNSKSRNTRGEHMTVTWHICDVYER